MGLIYHKRPRFGPLYANLGAGRGRGLLALIPRVTSWGWHLGPWTHNVTNDQDTLNLPGDYSYRGRRRRTRRRG